MSDKTPVDELEGRELDAAVAGEMMGHDTDSLTKMPGAGPYKSQEYDLHFPNGMPLPYYSKEIAAAWGVLDALKGVVSDKDIHAAEIRLQTEEMRDGWAQWTCRIQNQTGIGRSGKEVLWLASSESAAEAICRAALRAVRDE